MIKNLIAALLLMAFCVQILSKPFIIADYYARTAAYARNCINKARPQMHCNGKCQLMKKLQDEEKKEAENAERKDNKTDLSIFPGLNFATLHERNFILIISAHFRPESNGHPISRSFGIFHPPQA